MSSSLLYMSPQFHAHIISNPSLSVVSLLSLSSMAASFASWFWRCRNRNYSIDWKIAGEHDYDKFDVKSSEYISNVDVSVSLGNCTDRSCELHEGEIDRLYGDFIKSLHMAANNCIPRRKSGTRQQTAG